jgi:hypothetical protein
MTDAMAETTAETKQSAPDRERVAQRAYELYVARGCADGRADDDWYCAERELTTGRSRGDA